MKKLFPFIARHRTLLLVAVLGMLLLFWLSSGSTSTIQFRTAPVQRGDLRVTISATGTLEPEEVIDVGAQVAGIITSFGTDNAGKIIDYGSEVKAGQVLAQIDDAVYRSDVLQGEAELKRAQADVQQYKAKLLLAGRDWERAQKLGASDALSQTAYDSYRSAFEVAKANVGVGEAQVSQAEASLVRAKRNFDFSVIRSPVDGVIIDRKVNIGQTVVASLNAPSLFLIAKDLKRMQVWVSVNEADIGSIRPGQRASFGVDAFPRERFEGRVGKIRLNATMSQNVVTYIVEVATDNDDGNLLPYLTANVEFEISNEQNALLVPNAALRWVPKEESMLPELRKARTAPESKEPRQKKQKQVWVRDGDYVRPLPVTALGTDEVLTAISGEGVNEGLEVIIGEEIAPDESAPKTTNPFAPQIPRRGGR